MKTEVWVICAEYFLPVNTKRKKEKGYPHQIPSLHDVQALFFNEYDDSIFCGAITLSGELYIWGSMPGFFFATEAHRNIEKNIIVPCPQRAVCFTGKRVKKIFIQPGSYLGCGKLGLAIIDDNVYGWGYSDYFGNMRPVPEPLKQFQNESIVDIDFSKGETEQFLFASYMCALTSNGDIICSFFDKWSPRKPKLPKIAQIACCEEGIVVLSEEGKVYMSDDEDEFIEKDLCDSICSICNAKLTCFFLSNKGNVYYSKYENIIKIKEIDEVTQIWSTKSNKIIRGFAKKNDGSIWEIRFRDIRFRDKIEITKMDLFEGKNIIQIVGGDDFTIALTSDLERVRKEEEIGLNLANDLATALNNPLYSDIKFIVEDKTIYAHKIILTSRCSTFKKMFTSGMEESNKDTIEISDMKYDTFYGILEYIYRGETKITHENAVALLTASNQYLLPSLQEECEMFISYSSITIDNVCQLYQIADSIEAKFLKSICGDFIEKNIEQLSDTLEYKQITKLLKKRKREKELEKSLKKIKENLSDDEEEKIAEEVNEN